MPSPAPPFPQDFGNYVLLRKLAKGGMAELFVATVRGRSERVVIKRVLPSYSSEAEFLKMFLNEARIAAQLAHPNIVRVFDLGQQGDHLYLAMEFIDGFDLDAITRVAGGRLPPEIAASIAASICEALYYANRVVDRAGRPLNVVHRDVTPGNVMLTRAGVVKLVDFGVAKAAASIDKTRPGVVKGKFRYMSPEQVSFKELDGRSDLFSVGVLLYEVTTGQRPFERKQVLDTIQALSSWDPPAPQTLLPHYPPRLSNIIVQALEKDRGRRFQSGKEMKQALEAALPRPVATAEIAAFIADLSRKHPDRLPPPDPADVAPSRGQPLDSLSLPTDPFRAAPPRSLATTSLRMPRAGPPGGALLSTPDEEVEDGLQMPTSQISGAEVQRLLAEAEQQLSARNHPPPANGTPAPGSKGESLPPPSSGDPRPDFAEARGAPSRDRPIQPRQNLAPSLFGGAGEFGDAATRIASRSPVAHPSPPVDPEQQANSTLRDAPIPRHAEAKSDDRTLEGPYAPAPFREAPRSHPVVQSDLDTGNRPGRDLARRRAWPVVAGIVAALCLAVAAAWALLRASSHAPERPAEEPLASKARSPAAAHPASLEGEASWPSASPSSEAQMPSTPAAGATPVSWFGMARARFASTSARPRWRGSSASASTPPTWTRSS
jgi:serine/threonine protein kinase